ncbi:MAG: RagB/SusD family nutrient uptake outer membrane protein [Mangrovibacterium sp.]|tara:strand:- start:19025 stop:20689 length:1665 start_codon:yes stop_codon:yes gene_type:complete
MKLIFRYKHIVVAFFSLFATVACDDFLDTAPANLLSSDGFYQTPAQSEQGLMGVYADLRDLAEDEFLLLSECRSDNVWANPTPNALREFSEISSFRAGYDLPVINNAWNIWYKVIYDANVALVKIPDCDFGTNDAIKEQFLGEVHFLRGWAYFELVRLFGNIPIIDSPMSPSAVKDVAQSTAREVYDEIIVPDLIAAKSKLPLGSGMVDSKGSSIATSGRADKIAAQAMLARVYMTMAGFPVDDASALSLAETELKAVITYSESNGDKFWAPDSTEWRKQWMPADEYYNRYSIFAIQYRSGGTGNPAIFWFGPALPPTYTGQRIFGNDFWVEKSLMYEFDKTYSVNGEDRKDIRGIGYSVLTGYDAEPNFPAYSQTTDKLELADGTEVDVFTNSIFYKYLPSKRKIANLNMSLDVESSMLNADDWPVNLPIIRYEDILLMYAEILASKDVSAAMNIVNRIRQRAGCTPEVASSAAAAMESIKRERRVELMGEGVRWFDLVRWNEWQSAITDKFDRYNNPDGTDAANVKNGRYLYPIPLEQINVKPGFYQQNEGY